MEINNPFRFKQLNAKTCIKLDQNKINRMKQTNKLINHNIKSIWNDETNLLNNKFSPLKMKKTKILLNEYYTNRIKKK